jgi:hypothetical protein
MMAKSLATLYIKTQATQFPIKSMAQPRHIIILLLLAVAFGFLIGAIGQRYYGFGNLLRMAGVNYPLFPQPSQKPELTPGDVHDVIPEEFRGKLSLFILAGQSNIAGFGELPLEQVVHPRVFVFGNNYRWSVAREPIDAPNEQVDKVSMDIKAGFGPGLAFALSLLERNPNTVIGLIPCAKGASSIEEWQRNFSDNTLYGSCLKRVRAATTLGAPAGLLVFQGEQDTVDSKLYLETSPSTSDYAIKFSTFVDDFRIDLALPELPVVFAQIGTNKAPEVFVNWEVVKKQQEMIKLLCVAMVKTDDLSLSDSVHFTTESYRTIGERYAEAMAPLLKPSQDCR